MVRCRLLGKVVAHVKVVTHVKVVAHIKVVAHVKSSSVWSVYTSLGIALEARGWRVTACCLHGTQPTGCTLLSH